MRLSVAIKYWITGSGSGLGKYLLQNLDSSQAFDPRTSLAQVNSDHIEEITLINCGFKRILHGQKVSYGDFHSNILLQHQLSQLPFKRVILCSSVDVYPSDDVINIETRQITNSNVKSIYSYQKLLNENFFLTANSNTTVIRLPMIFGNGCQDNSVTKIISGSQLTLSHDSVINVIDYYSIMLFIGGIEKNSLSGIFNLVASQNSRLDSLASHLKRDIKYGSYRYITPKVSNQKVVDLFPELDRTTVEVIKGCSLK